MKLRVCALAGLGLIALATGRACGDVITFDGPGYVAGQRPPAPWKDAYDGTRPVVFTVTAGAGLSGTQGLGVYDNPYFEGAAIYDLPQPLTSADGPQRVSVRVDLPPAPSNGYVNFCSYGGVHIGNGSFTYDYGTIMGVIFRNEDWSYSSSTHPQDFKVNSPGGFMGNFVPSAAAAFTTVTFDMNAAWDRLTFTVTLPGGAAMSNSAAWDGSPISRIWLWPAATDLIGSGPIVYDDLSIGPVGLQIGGGGAGGANGMDFQVQVQSVLGKTYSLERTQQLGSGSWEVVVSGVAGTGGVIALVDPGALETLGHACYRVGEQ